MLSVLAMKDSPDIVIQAQSKCLPLHVLNVCDDNKGFFCSVSKLSLSDLKHYLLATRLDNQIATANGTFT